MWVEAGLVFSSDCPIDHRAAEATVGRQPPGRGCSCQLPPRTRPGSTARRFHTASPPIRAWQRPAFGRVFQMNKKQKTHKYSPCGSGRGRGGGGAWSDGRGCSMGFRGNSSRLARQPGAGGRLQLLGSSNRASACLDPLDLLCTRCPAPGPPRQPWSHARGMRPQPGVWQEQRSPRSPAG